MGVLYTRDKILFSAGKNVGNKDMREMVSKIISMPSDVECILNATYLWGISNLLISKLPIVWFVHKQNYKTVFLSLSYKCLTSNDSTQISTLIIHTNTYITAWAISHPIANGSSTHPEYQYHTLFLMSNSSPHNLSKRFWNLYSHDHIKSIIWYFNKWFQIT